MNNRLWNCSHSLYKNSSRKIVHRMARILEIIYNVIFGNSISTEAEIGRGTTFFHHGIGCVVHRDAVIGDNCKIFGNVTIGCKWSDGINKGNPPKIGDNVLIGAGAVLLGDILIEDNVFVGANAVVLQNVPKNSIVVCNPAIIKRREL